jgi:hypothetical protein
LPGIGDVEVQARKTYVALLTPRRTFAAVQPTTRSRIDLGVRLSPGRATARLERARNFGQSSVTHIIRLGSPEAVDDEVEGWRRPIRSTLDRSAAAAVAPARHLIRGERVICDRPRRGDLACCALVQRRGDGVVPEHARADVDRRGRAMFDRLLGEQGKSRWHFVMCVRGSQPIGTIGLFDVDEAVAAPAWA